MNVKLRVVGVVVGVVSIMTMYIAYVVVTKGDGIILAASSTAAGALTMRILTMKGK